MRRTEPTWRPSLAEISIAFVPLRASFANRAISSWVQSFGRNVVFENFMEAVYHSVAPSMKAGAGDDNLAPLLGLLEPDECNVQPCARGQKPKEKAAGRYAVGPPLRLPAQRPVLPHSVAIMRHYG